MKQLGVSGISARCPRCGFRNAIVTETWPTGWNGVKFPLPEFRSGEPVARRSVEQECHKCQLPWADFALIDAAFKSAKARKAMSFTLPVPQNSRPA